MKEDFFFIIWGRNLGPKHDFFFLFLSCSRSLFLSLFQKTVRTLVLGKKNCRAYWQMARCWNETTALRGELFVITRAGDSAVRYTAHKAEAQGLLILKFIIGSMALNGKQTATGA